MPPFAHVGRTRSTEKRSCVERGSVARNRNLELPLLLILPITFVCLAAGGAGAKNHNQDDATGAGPTTARSISADRGDQADKKTSSSCGPPHYSCSYDGVDPKPLCTDCSFPPVPDMSAEPNAVWYDKVFGLDGRGNQIVRCTYPDTQDNNNYSWMIGSGGSGDSNAIGKAGGTPPTYRLMIGNIHGWAYPFTFTPDPLHPQCRSTYSPMSSFPVGDGSFSWVTPHLYYFFDGYNFKIKSLDLGSRKPPTPIPVADFQQILPREGPDWPGPGQAIALGRIIAPRSNNPGKYLYQATCPAALSSCAPGVTGQNVPGFSQNVMYNTTDGTVKWRNIGVGFNSPPIWSVIGGVSTDDDVFVQGFSDAGGQGGPGATFVAAYKRSTNIYYLYNVGTGIVSYFTCEGGSGFACQAGHWRQTIVGITTLPDRFVLHNVKLNKNGQWVVIVLDQCWFNTCSVVPGSFGPYFWQLSTTEARVNKVTTHPYGHWTEGSRLFVNLDTPRGVTLYARPFADPQNVFPVNRYDTSLPWFSRPTEPGDAHPSWNYNDGSDTTPVCTETVGFDWPYVIPWENEVVCYGTNPSPTCSADRNPLCQTVVKRFFHTYNPVTCDSEEDFWGCWGIGGLSQDGKYYAFTSNWGDTLGSTSHGGHGAGSCKGGFNFQTDHEYQAGDVFEPSNGGHEHANSFFNAFKVTVAGKSASYPPGPWPTGWRLKQNASQGYYQNGDTILPHFNNPCNHLFKVTAGGGSPNGSKFPDWQSVYDYRGSCTTLKTGTTLQDGNITWTDTGEFVLGTMHLANLGRDDCRADVFIGTLN